LHILKVSLLSYIISIRWKIIFDISDRRGNLQKSITGGVIMDLTTLANLARIIGSVAVISGIIFGIIQVRQYQQQRRDIAAVQLVNSFQNPDFNKSLRKIWSLPDDASVRKIRDLGDNWEEAAFQVGMTLETMGVLVYRRIVPLSILDELMGDAILVLWRKLRPWVEHLRTEQQRDSAYEWFQWLADRLSETDRRTGAGAYKLHRHWRK